jgi:hypothetical protein
VLGVALIVLGWLGDDGTWESVFIEVGSAFALIVVILLVEDAWRADVGARITQIQEDVAEVRSNIPPIRAIHAEQRARRTSSDDAMIAAWVADPRPATLWPIANRCNALRLSLPQQTLIGDAVVVFNPSSPDTIELTIQSRSSQIGKPGYRRVRWEEGTDLVEVIHQVDEALASLRVHPGPERFDFGGAVTSVGEIYARQISVAFGDSTNGDAAASPVT